MEAGRKPVLSRWAWSLLALGVLLMAGNRVIRLMNRAREHGGVSCSSNMRQLGQAIQLYANAHQGHLPDTLEQLLLTEDLWPEILVCPNSNDSKAVAPTTQEVVNLIQSTTQPTLNARNASGHLSYIYVGKGLIWPVNPDVVLIYEPLQNHDRDGMNILFGDGHAEWLPAAKALEVISKIPATPPAHRP